MTWRSGRGQQEVSQLGGPLAAGQRLTTEATPSLSLDDLSPSGDWLSRRGNFDDVI